jgi:ABC-type proline/glycine betaine transport system permease subunit
MEFDLAKTAAMFVAVVAIAVAVSLAMPMTTSTVFMMVLPSVAVFGLLMLAIGVKHGEYRTTHR